LGSDIQAIFLTPDWPLNFGYIAILSVAGSAFANVIFYYLVRDTSPVVASVVAYFIPVVATMWGLADNEHPASTRSDERRVGLEFRRVLFRSLGSDIQAIFLTPDWPLNFGYIAILSVAGSAFANVIFYYLVRDTSPVVASVVAYFIPVVATMWGLADNEHPAPT